MDYRDILASVYESRRNKNTRYSRRAFARGLGISKTALCDVLRKSRHLSKRGAAVVAERLGWSNELRVQMCQQIRTGLTRRPRYPLPFDTGRVSDSMPGASVSKGSGYLGE